MFGCLSALSAQVLVKVSVKIQLFYNCNNKTVPYNCNTTNNATIISLRRELRTPSYLVFWNFTKYLRNVFETALNGQA